MKSKVKSVLLIVLMLISLVGIALTVNDARENKQEKLIIASLSFISDTIVSLLILSFKEKAIAFCFPIFPGVSIISLPKATTVPPFIIYPASVSIPASPPTSLPRTKRVPPFITAFQIPIMISLCSNNPLENA